MKILGKTTDGNLIVEMSQLEWDKPELQIQDGWSLLDQKPISILKLPTFVHNKLARSSNWHARYPKMYPILKTLGDIHSLMINSTKFEFCVQVRQFGDASYNILREKMIEAGYTDLRK